MQLTAVPLTQTLGAPTHVRLEPFAEAHRAGLIVAAADPSIWRHIPFPVLTRGYDAWFDQLREMQAAGAWMPFAVIAPSGEIVGQSCYLAIRAADAGVEIGGTWYAPAAQGTQINPAAKLVLLDHAFACGAERVELKTDALNLRSRAAILKLGAQFEGIFRHHMRRPDGSWRDTAYYSVLQAEWPALREKLRMRLGPRGD